MQGKLKTTAIEAHRSDMSNFFEIRPYKGFPAESPVLRPESTDDGKGQFYAHIEFLTPDFRQIRNFQTPDLAEFL